MKQILTPIIVFLVIFLACAAVGFSIVGIFVGISYIGAWIYNTWGFFWLFSISVVSFFSFLMAVMATPDLLIFMKKNKEKEKREKEERVSRKKAYLKGGS